MRANIAALSAFAVSLIGLTAGHTAYAAKPKPQGLVVHAAVYPLVSAQAVSREVVQPLPPRSSGALNRALRTLAGSPRNLDALIKAGDASLDLADHDAAVGFFTRAREVAPQNSRVIHGLARAQLNTGRPVIALKLFDEAVAAGIGEAVVAPDRALALDLVGDNAAAQALYRAALSADENAELRRRLALSHAISGNKPAFERELFVQLESGDRAGFRARSFGLAILGDTDEAVKIAEALMPTDLALRMAPYLRYMPRLTKAQQAAAANLGVFPRAANIGTDDPSIAGYAAQGADIAARADNALTPSGTRLGAKDTAASSLAAAPAIPSKSEAVPEKLASAELPPVTEPEAVLPAPEPAPEPTPEPQLEPEPQPEPVRLAVAPKPEPEPAVQPVAQPVAQASEPKVATVTELAPVPVRAPAPEPIAASVTAPPSPPALVPATASAPQPQRVADAFSDMALPSKSIRSASDGAVNIAEIEPPRERVAPPEPEPEVEEPTKGPEHPARHWVQIATGKDRAALRYDWRRLSRKAEGQLDENEPFVASWGETNRMLTGPYDTLRQARAASDALNQLDIDSFAFSSAQDQVIEPLP